MTDTDPDTEALERMLEEVKMSLDTLLMENPPIPTAEKRRTNRQVACLVFLAVLVTFTLMALFPEYIEIVVGLFFILVWITSYPEKRNEKGKSIRHFFFRFFTLSSL